MGEDVSIYVKYSGDRHDLTHRIGEQVRAVWYFSYGDSYLIPVRTQRWIGIDDFAQITVDRTSLGLDGDPGLAADTAFAPYEFVLDLEFGGGPADERLELTRRLGLELFTRLTRLELPMAFGGWGQIFADYLPDRGIRAMPPDTDEEKSRAVWFEPRLHTRPEQPWPVDLSAGNQPPAGPTTIYETNGLLQLATAVPHGGEALWAIPAPAVRLTTGAEEIGALVAVAQRPSSAAVTVPTTHLLTSFADTLSLSTMDFLRRSVAVEIRPEPDGPLAVAHAASNDGEHLGPVVPEFTRRLASQATPYEVGQVLTELCTSLRPTARWTGATPDQVVAAMQTYVLKPGEDIRERRDGPGSVSLRTRPSLYTAAPADWRVGAQTWVAAAVRIVASSLANTLVTYGLVFEQTGAVGFLNDVATMRALGGRVGADLDPLAYAELLAELYSGRHIDGPVVSPSNATPLHPAGELIDDVGEFLIRYPFARPSLVETPTVWWDRDRIHLRFCSGHAELVGGRIALDILQWTVTAGAGQDATWNRQYVVEQLEH
jgi:hypothetical protein